MPRSVDGEALAADLSERLSGQVVQAILAEIFPDSALAFRPDESEPGEEIVAAEPESRRAEELPALPDAPPLDRKKPADDSNW